MDVREKTIFLEKIIDTVMQEKASKHTKCRVLLLGIGELLKCYEVNIAEDVFQELYLTKEVRNIIFHGRYKTPLSFSALLEFAILLQK